MPNLRALKSDGHSTAGAAAARSVLATPAAECLSPQQQAKVILMFLQDHPPATAAEQVFNGVLRAHVEHLLSTAEH